MKKLFGVAAPILIIAVVVGLLLLAYANDRKGYGCSLENEPGAQIGMQYFQTLIEQIEQYKAEHGKYPENLENINQDTIGKGKSFPHKNITGASVNLRPDKNYFKVEFTFKNDYVCLLGQPRRCTYANSVYWGGKDTERGSWKCD